MKNADWGEIYKKLIAFSESEMDRYSWRLNTFPQGHTAESIVQEAIESILNNKRNWDPEKGPLDVYLIWVIKSKINHLYNSKTYHPEDIIEENLNQDEDEEWKRDEIEFTVQANNQKGNVSNSPEEILSIYEFSNNEIEEKLYRLIEACDNNEELKEIINVIFYGKCEPKAKSIAEYLNKPVKEIYSQLRAIRSRARKIQMDMGKASR